MPLQSSGIIVVEKTSSANSNATASGPIYEYYETTSDDKITNTNKTNSNNNLMRRHQRTISSSSTSSTLSPSSTSSGSAASVQHMSLKHHQLSTLANSTIQNYNQMNQQQQQPQTTAHVLQTAGHGHHNQVIVSEEYIEHAAAAGANVINISANDLLHQPQIIKLVSADGNTTGNVIIDAMGNVTTTTNGAVHHAPHSHGHHHHHNHPNSSKVLVSNLTVVSKQANNSQSSAVVAAGQPQQQQQQTINFVNAKSLPYMSSQMTSSTGKGQTQSVQKIVNIPSLKKNNVLSANQQHHSTLMSGQQVVQKVTVPRNVQLVTRVQTLVPPQQNANNNPQPNQMIMQQKYVHNIVGTPAKINNSGNNSNVIKKQSNNQSIKVQQHKIMSQHQGVKTFIQQQSSQQQHYQTIGVHQVGSGVTTTKQVKSQKSIKQYNNSQSGNNSSTQMANLSSTGTYTISNKMQHSTTTKITKHSNTKYVMQNHIVLPSSNAASPSCTTSNNHKINSNSIVVNHQQILNSINNASGTSNSGTIKFVNAHGTVIQQHQQQSTTTQKIKNNFQQQQQQQQTTTHQILTQSPSQSQHFTDNGNKDNNVYHVTTSYIQNSPTQQQQKQQTAALGDDFMIVNGTQMTDEISARILQSMAQKSYSNQRYQQQQTTQKVASSPTMQPPPPPSQNHSSNTSNMILSPSPSKEYPVYNSGTSIQYQRQANSTPNSRSQSAERKVLDVSVRKGSDYFRVSSHDILQSSYHSPSSSSSTTLIDNIPLPTHNQSSKHQRSDAEQDEDIIGEEVRPLPVNTLDMRLQALHAVMQDHTYVASAQSRMQAAIEATQQQQQQQTIVVASSPSSNQLASNSVILGRLTPASANGNAVVPQSPNQTSFTIFGQQIPRLAPDDDANSVISNGSRNGNNDNDLGEETETAPEAEAEDDSVTRCICDLTHDDGYMICCDKCSAWQHVDCMGIDRQNIPEEYLCEMCQPRPVDKARARSLQLIKRKEQTQMLLNAQLNAAGSAGVLLPSDATGQLLAGAQVLTSTAASGSVSATKKGKMLKRKEMLKKGGKKEKPAGKRRETKKTTKRKTKTTGGDAVDKHAANLRQWIENYEAAVTNHYSPELRARLHAISKQPNLLQSITATENRLLKSCGDLENTATTVPHAGGKILISNFDLQPNSPILELRGKYMLTTQYKTQNPSINMNSPPPTNYFQSLKGHKTPGPFIFFYQVPMESNPPNTITGPEICVDTRTYGNEARFVRRSCRPNAVIQHSFEKGTIHLYIVALTNIMASTEITIRHEPHDLIAIENKKAFNCVYIVQPTSTTCACGLTKDCLFGVPPPPPEKTSTQKSTRSNNKAVLNGGLEKIAAKKKSLNANRGRSTSSSGESNTGLLSPNINNNSLQSSLMHDSGVYTSSSSPSVSIPSPTHTHVISSPSQVTPQVPLVQVPEIEQQSKSQIEQPPQQSKIVPPEVQQQTAVVVSAQPQEIPEIVPAPVVGILPSAAPTQEQKEPEQQEPQPQFELKAQPQLQDQQDEAIQNAIPVTPVESIQQPPILKPTVVQPPTMQTVILQHPTVTPTIEETAEIPQQKSPQKRTPQKMPRTSISEDTQSPTDAPPSTETPQKQTLEQKRESRKLTREERKMEAIVRAFEKMEKNQQRKQELKQSKTGAPTGSKRRNSNSPSPKRVKLPSVSDSHSGCDTSMSTNTHKKSATMRKKKRKGHKAYTTNNVQRKRRKSRINSNESDAVTSEESTSMLSPPIKGQGMPPGMPNAHAIANRQMDPQNDPNVSQAAGLLLAFAKADSTAADHLTTPEKSFMPQRTPETPPTVVSSTCMLLEAAVGPLEGLDTFGANDSFKLPTKTKTKKTLMNSWLNQKGEYTEQSSPGHFSPGLESLVQAAAISEYRKSSASPSFMGTPATDEPQNLSMVAKKVEEFINQTDYSSTSATAANSQDYKVKSQPLPTNGLALPLQISTCSNNSSVKKRWLRQAISEETDEHQSTTPSSTSPTSQPNGFTTPLKKRRLLLQGAQNLEGPELNKSASDSSLSNEAKEEIKEEYDDIKEEDDVDILTSPSPDQVNIIAEDNLVKIEPEDTNAAEINIDVEQEESVNEKIEYEPPVELKEEEKVQQVMEVKKEEVIPVPVPAQVSIEPKIESGPIALEVKEDKVTPEIKMEEPIESKPEIKTEGKPESARKKLKSEEKLPKPKKPKQLLTSASTGNANQKLKTSVKSEVKVEKFDMKSASNVPADLEKAASVKVADEIADIQKRLHSFHKENIMILQSRNKKSKKSSETKLEALKDKSAKKGKKEKKSPSTKESKYSKDSKDSKNATSVEDSGKKSKNRKKDEKEKLDKHRSSSKKRLFDEGKNESKTESGKKRRESAASVRSEDSQPATPIGLVENPIAMQYPIPVTSNLIPMSAMMPPVPLVPHMQNFSNIQVQAIPTVTGVPPAAMPTHLPTMVPTTVQTMQQIPTAFPNNYLTSPPPPCAQFPPVERASSLPYFKTIYGKFSDSTPAVAAGLQLPPPQSPSASVIGGMPMPVAPPAATTSSNLLLSDYMETKAKSYNILGGYVSHTHNAFFGKSAEVTNASAMDSPASTLIDKMTPNKIVTKTASSDPRLNPILTAPEPSPTPKRKLSINEYRKRKQQSCESGTGSPEGETPSKSFCLSKSASSSSGSLDSERAESAERRDSESYSKADDDSKVTFSPAPTLREIYNERLKSLKPQGLVSPLSTSASISAELETPAKKGLILGNSSQSAPVTTSTNSFNFDNSLEAISSSSSSASSTPERAASPPRSSTPPIAQAPSTAAPEMAIMEDIEKMLPTSEPIETAQKPSPTQSTISQSSPQKSTEAIPNETR